MTASQNDKVRGNYNSANPVTTYVTTIRTAGATTLICNNLTGWNTANKIDFVTYQLNSAGDGPEPGTQIDWTGIVSGSTITNLARVGGATDTGNAVNDIVEAMPTAKWGQDLADAINEEHGITDGYHSKALKDSNGNEWLAPNATSSAVNHLQLSNAATGTNPTLAAIGDDSNVGLTLKAKGTGEILITDGSGNEISLFDYVASAVNYMGIVPSATGNPVALQALGDDSNIDLELTPKGTGRITKNGNNVDTWEEIGRTTLGSASDTITVSSIPERKYIQVVVSTLNTGGTVTQLMTFNNDSGNNYAIRNSDNFGAGSTSTSRANLPLNVNAGSYPTISITNVINISTREKIGNVAVIEQNTSGAGNAPISRQGLIKWANTSDPINRVDVTNSGTGDFASGSEVIVLGHN